MKKKKDVLFLCQYFYPEYVSSATLPFDTALSLKEAGFSVDAICGYPREYNLKEIVPLKETHKGINIKRLKYIQLKRSNFIGRLINYFSFTISVAFRFINLKNYRTIIVYSNPPVLPFIATVANKIFGTKVIFVSYDIYPEIAYMTNTITKHSILSKIMNFINKSVFKRINTVVALSNEMKSYLLEHRASLAPEQIEVIPNWYKDTGIADNESEINNSLLRSIKSNSNLVVSYFGNMGIAQDIETIIEAIRILRNDSNVHFLFAGHGNKMGILKTTIEQENLKNVTVFDFLHGQDFQDALSISDCFIVSLAEGLTGLAVPSKTYSYMMAGKPIIAIMGEESDIAKDLIENEAGYSVQGRESLKMVSAIEELRSDSEKLKNMGKNCREIFLNKYTEEKCTHQYVRMMQRILGD
ncbi:glycosyltransferase family 4 protein [Ureibacillus manganicus]|uniref:Capsular biosynthesis protein n=1 Tax=Ureibacillus manganicus DSM 26584 TaxID=1384049 RepID=A0A0A3I195_9BACL|nr:glycosyltransferase family 4 protein [Ureibacillus manganicus]KGR76408.1 capsular biosynthesis protein [Ureibacillus manganicus DSM 26584]